MFAMRREQLLRADGSVSSKRHLCREHELLPAVHNQRDQPDAMPHAMLHEWHLQRLDKLRCEQLCGGVFLGGFVSRARAERWRVPPSSEKGFHVRFAHAEEFLSQAGLRLGGSAPIPPRIILGPTRKAASKN